MLNQQLNVHYVEFPRPRPELVDLLGEENQSCPVLVLTTVPRNLPSNLKVHQAHEHSFVEGTSEIAEYLAQVHGVGIPHL